MNQKPSEADNDAKKFVEGTITARKCDCCGHHEIGMVTRFGKYIALKPGMKVRIIGDVEC